MITSKIQTVDRSRFKITDSVQLDSGVKVPVITGQVGQVDVVSPNGYRYIKGFWDKVLSDSNVIDSINSRDMFGMIEHPTDDNEYMKTPYEKASHVILKAWVKDGNPFAQIGLLNNERGNQLKALVDVGHRPGVSTRGLGSIEKDSVSSYIPDKDYMFLTWDIVRSPNFGDLKMDKVTDSLVKSPLFQELVEMHQLQDSVDDHYNEMKLESDMEKVINALDTIKNYILNKR